MENPKEEPKFENSIDNTMNIMSIANSMFGKKEEPKPFKQMEQLTEVDWEKFKKSPFPSKKVPKQETLTNDTDSHSWGFENFEVIKTEEDAKIFVETMENIPEPNDKLKKAFKEFNKQKTLEEVANRLFFSVGNDGISNIDSFIKGAKWQAERMYSEEDMWEAYKASNTIFEDEIALRQEFEEWFEQFKKK